MGSGVPLRAEGFEEVRVLGFRALGLAKPFWGVSPGLRGLRIKFRVFCREPIWDVFGFSGFRASGPFRV